MIEAIVVERGKANTLGPDFVSILLEGRRSMIERGRVELDKAEPSSTMTLRTIYLPNIRRSDIIEVIGSEFGPRRVGVVTSYQHSTVLSQNTKKPVPVGATTTIETKIYDASSLTTVI